MLGKLSLKKLTNVKLDVPIAIVGRPTINSILLVELRSPRSIMDSAGLF